MLVDHVCFWSGKTLVGELEKKGFQIRETVISGTLFPWGWAGGIKKGNLRVSCQPEDNEKTSNSSKSATYRVKNFLLQSKKAYAFIKYLNNVFHLGDNLEVYAIKKSSERQSRHFFGATAI